MSPQSQTTGYSCPSGDVWSTLSNKNIREHVHTNQVPIKHVLTHDTINDDCYNYLDRKAKQASNSKAVSDDKLPACVWDNDVNKALLMSSFMASIMDEMMMKTTEDGCVNKAYLFCMSKKIK